MSESPILISEAYRRQQEQLHVERSDYGVASLAFGVVVTDIVNAFKAKTLTDYGCGKGRLLEVFAPDHGVRVQLYDPAIPEHSAAPVPTEVVACIDVLEHIEPEHLEAVLADLRRVTQKVLFATIHCGPAVKTLADGRNAHLIQEQPSWWLARLFAAGFELLDFNRNRHGFEVVLAAFDLTE